MEKKLQGKVALVTGGASGLGKETVLRLARDGARVVVTDLNEDAGRSVAAEAGAGGLFLRHDVASEDDWARVMAAVQAQCGALDVLVNNAGILLAGSVETLAFEQWQRMFRVNTDSVFLGTRAGVAAMKERGGVVVNIASVSSWLPIDSYAGYGATKAAVAALTRAAALHCRKSRYPVRVNSVHPDGVYTPMMQAQAPGVDPKYLLFDVRRNPSARACMPAEVASVVAFLASDDAKAISGAELRVDNAIMGMGL